ncbi:RraA family protein [Paenarthrobacter ureafaciens]
MGHVPGGVKIAGPAVTVRIADRDAIAMNRALLALRPGDVLVVDMLGDNRHAPVGAVTAAAAIAQGAAAVVVDGVATDVRELREAGLPVFARGTSCLTTKRVRGAGSAVNVPVHCGGVQVNPGDIVLGDDNGLIVLAPEAAREVLPRALAPTRPSPPSWPASRPGNRSNRSLPCNTTGARAATCCATSELGPGMG